MLTTPNFQQARTQSSVEKSKQNTSTQIMVTGKEVASALNDLMNAEEMKAIIF